MTLYARTDINRHSSQRCPKGGHSRTTNRKGEFTDERLVIDCTDCEAEIIAIPALRNSFSVEADNIPLTDAEIRAAKKRETDAMATTAELADALARQAKDAVLAGK